MLDHPLAFHITFGTYGMRLHGDHRGTVLRARNRPGEPIIGRDDIWTEIERSKLTFDPVVLDLHQRQFVEQVIPSICDRGGWRHYISAAQRDHVHVLLEATAEGMSVRRWLKRWLGQTLSERWPDVMSIRSRASSGVKPTWWAEGGSVRWVWDEKYLETAYAYILAQRTTT